MGRRIGAARAAFSLCGLFVWRRLADGNGTKTGALHEPLELLVELAFLLWRLDFVVVHAALSSARPTDNAGPTFWSHAIFATYCTLYEVHPAHRARHGSV